MIDILTRLLQHDEQAVLIYVELSLVEDVLTKIHVLSAARIGRSDGMVIGGPPLLALHREPKANVERYDGLHARTLETVMRHDPAASAPDQAKRTSI